MKKLKFLILLFVFVLLGIVMPYFCSVFINKKTQNFELEKAVVVTPSADEIKRIKGVGKNKIINVQCWQEAGLGNRLKKIISYLRYYRPKHLNLFGVNEGWVNANFFDLFIVNWPVTISEFNDKSIIALSGDQVALYKYIGNSQLLITKEDFKGKEPFNIDGQFNNIPDNIKKIYLPYFTQIKPSLKVQKRIEELNLPKKFIPVHVRINDDWLKYYGSNFSLSSFFEKMDSYPKDTVFYLSAMSKEIAEHFYNRYPNRIIELPNKDYHSMIDAVADLFVLGSQEETIYSFGSTFSEVAWWIGGAKAKVILVAPDKTFKIKKYLILDKIY